jgi:dihydroorotase
MVGLESALRVVQLAMVDTGALSWSDVARVLSRKPAEIGGLTDYETPFAFGNPANFTLYDPSGGRGFGVDDLRGKGRNSPYLGRELPGRVVVTVHDGYPTLLDGALVDEAEVSASALASALRPSAPGPQTRNHSA